MDQSEKFRLALEAAADIVSKALAADIVVYHGDILRGNDNRLNSLISVNKTLPNVAFFLTTPGGDPDAAFRIARCLHNAYEKFILFVGSYCKSAGTLISIGADEIVLSDMAELGPLDIQIAKDDDFFARDSGLTPVQALSTLRAETFKAFEHHFMNILGKSGGQITTLSAATYATRLTTECFSEIYKQIDPMKLGDFERATNITYQYGLRLDRGNLKDHDALMRLITDYPSHGFVIDRQEAQTLFKNVRRPDEFEMKLIGPVLMHGDVIRHSSEKTAIEFLSPRPMMASKEPKTRRGSNGRATRKSRRKPGTAAGATQPGRDFKDSPGSSREKLPEQRAKSERPGNPRSGSPRKLDGNGKAT